MNSLDPISYNLSSNSVVPKRTQDRPVFVYELLNVNRLNKKYGHIRKIVLDQPIQDRNIQFLSKYLTTSLTRGCRLKPTKKLVIQANHPECSLQQLPLLCFDRVSYPSYGTQSV